MLHQKKQKQKHEVVDIFEGVRVGDKALEELEKVVIEKDEKVIAKPRVETYGKASISEAEKAPILQTWAIPGFSIVEGRVL